ncbi:hypothetical protein [Streptoalloteichus hindustanus]|uniref:Uncharacterized protein n=1 Tax=Streptoalloteichus hindustanus TaxID=2017 RepID=A0A1M5H6B7_STRHI|nr:hypothetical protein [Streptoalloteichus hindustanus]SHG11540.1 hypothetical protein SAMN05444320_106422 [Streptoalloteichus hindustanus]
MTDRADRAAFLAFVRANHPDVGGDHDAFVAGLAALRATPGAGNAATRPDRWDAPIVARPGGLRGMVSRWRDRRHRRHRRLR